MYYQYCKRLVIALLLLPLVSTAQQQPDLTGLWKGYIYNDTTNQNLRYEVGISLEKGKLTGFSHTFFIIDDKPYYGVKKIKLRRKGDKVIIEDVSLIANNYPIAPPKGVHQISVLELDIKDSIMVLSGVFETTRTREYHPLTGKVYLQRKNDFRQSALVPHLTELKMATASNFMPAEKINPEPASTVEPGEPIAIVTTLEKADNTPSGTINNQQPAAVNGTLAGSGSKPVTVGNAPATVEEEATLAKPTNNVVNTMPQQVSKAIAATTISAKELIRAEVRKPVITYEPASELANRTIETVETVQFSSDSLQLTLYDNGEVDGDTVSVLLNGTMLLAKQGLSTKPIRKTIYIPKGTDAVQLVMYAESLGSIPPNTGLLVVKDGETVYEVRFSADTKKNAAILFQRRR